MCVFCLAFDTSRTRNIRECCKGIQPLKRRRPNFICYVKMSMLKRVQSRGNRRSAGGGVHDEQWGSSHVSASCQRRSTSGTIRDAGKIEVCSGVGTFHALPSHPSLGEVPRRQSSWARTFRRPPSAQSTRTRRQSGSERIGSPGGVRLLAGAWEPCSAAGSHGVLSTQHRCPLCTVGDGDGVKPRQAASVWECLFQFEL